MSAAACKAAKCLSQARASTESNDELLELSTNDELDLIAEASEHLVATVINVSAAISERAKKND